MPYIITLWLLSLAMLLGACRSAPTIVRVDGDSMLPTLHSGQLIAINTCTREFSVGDIVLVNRGYGHPVCHRIIMLTATTVWLKGDNNDGIDHPLPRAAIIGKVIR